MAGAGVKRGKAPPGAVGTHTGLRMSSAAAWTVTSREEVEFEWSEASDAANGYQDEPGPDTWLRPRAWEIGARS